MASNLFLIWYNISPEITDKYVLPYGMCYRVNIWDSGVNIVKKESMFIIVSY